MFIEELRDLNIKFLEYRKGRYWQREQGLPTVTYITSTSKSLGTVSSVRGAV